MVIAAELSLLIVPDGAIPPNAGFVVPIPVPVLVPVPVPIPDPVPFPVPIPVPVPVPVPVPGGAMVGFVGVEELADPEKQAEVAPDGADEVTVAVPEKLQLSAVWPFF